MRDGINPLEDHFFRQKIELDLFNVSLEVDFTLLILLRAHIPVFISRIEEWQNTMLLAALVD